MGVMDRIAKSISFFADSGGGYFCEYFLQKPYTVYWHIKYSLPVSVVKIYSFGLIVSRGKFIYREQGWEILDLIDTIFCSEERILYLQTEFAGDEECVAIKYLKKKILTKAASEPSLAINLKRLDKELKRFL